MILKLKIADHGVGVLKVFKRGLKSIKYCKTYITDSEIIKKFENIDVNGSPPRSFRISALQ